MGQRISEAIYGEDSTQDKAASQGQGVGQRISEVVHGEDSSQGKAASEAKDAGRTTWEKLQSGAATVMQEAKGKLISFHAGGSIGFAAEKAKNGIAWGASVLL